MSKNVQRLFIVLFIHITLLDLFLVTTRGLVFLVQPSLKVETVVVHLTIVCLSCLMLLLVQYLFNKPKEL